MTMRLPYVGEGKDKRADDEKCLPILQRAYELGINFFDTAWGYINRDGQRIVGKGVKPFRDKIYLSSKLPAGEVQQPGDFRRKLEMSLRELDTDYIDFYHMLRVGQLIADTLNARGVRTVHSTALNDYPAYSGAYTRALKDIGAWVKKYPTVRIVIDVHRDAMMSGGKVYKTVAAIGGVQTAQLEFVAGTDAGGLSHDRWRQNLTYQVQLQYRLNTRFPGLMRPLNLRRGRFNQHGIPPRVLTFGRASSKIRTNAVRVRIRLL